MYRLKESIAWGNPTGTGVVIGAAVWGWYGAMCPVAKSKTTGPPERPSSARVAAKVCTPSPLGRMSSAGRACWRTLSGAATSIVARPVPGAPVTRATSARASGPVAERMIVAGRAVLGDSHGGGHADGQQRCSRQRGNQTDHEMAADRNHVRPPQCGIRRRERSGCARHRFFFSGCAGAPR